MTKLKGVCGVTGLLQVKLFNPPPPPGTAQFGAI
jgi:hypothetical protein